MPSGLPLNSRYLFIDTTQHKGEETLAWWAGAEWIDSAPARTVVAASGMAGRPDLVANKYLGSPDLWWVLVYYNKVTSVNWPRIGDVVLVPPRGAVLGRLNG